MPPPVKPSDSPSVDVAMEEATPTDYTRSTSEQPRVIHRQGADVIVVHEAPTQRDTSHPQKTTQRSDPCANTSSSFDTLPKLKDALPKSQDTSTDSAGRVKHDSKSDIPAEQRAEKVTKADVGVQERDFATQPKVMELPDLYEDVGTDGDGDEEVSDDDGDDFDDEVRHGAAAARGWL